MKLKDVMLSKPVILRKINTVTLLTCGEIEYNGVCEGLLRGGEMGNGAQRVQMFSHMMNKF